MHCVAKFLSQNFSIILPCYHLLWRVLHIKFKIAETLWGHLYFHSISQNTQKLHMHTHTHTQMYIYKHMCVHTHLPHTCTHIHTCCIHTYTHTHSGMKVMAFVSLCLTFHFSLENSGSQEKQVLGRHIWENAWGSRIWLCSVFKKKLWNLDSH